MRKIFQRVPQWNEEDRQQGAEAGDRRDLCCLIDLILDRGTVPVETRGMIMNVRRWPISYTIRSVFLSV